MRRSGAHSIQHAYKASVISTSSLKSTFSPPSTFSPSTISLAFFHSSWSIFLPTASDLPPSAPMSSPPPPGAGLLAPLDIWRLSDVTMDWTEEWYCADWVLKADLEGVGADSVVIAADASFRVLRTALRAKPLASSIIRTPVRRGYAEAASDKIKLSLTLPHQAIYKATDVYVRTSQSELQTAGQRDDGLEELENQLADIVQVNIPAESGVMGVLANHVPSIEQLKAGVVDIIEEGGGSKQFFVSGGFAVVQPNSRLSINAVEAYTLDEFSVEAVRAQLAEANKIASGSGSEQDIAEAKVEIEVLETLQAALKA
ncbi:LOW QUALITY PROTEIN: ATP synthase subunit [Drechslerella dactyloides]|uniref:ATP synthase subunit delta, mitochondrial n=1 Tax=Drechslerella dactyloides TaxID=74499 RepID=A0AAD6J2N0_DREDA|nr:LOW QUALITY PROTEIN: ATP synthase subunit [Drechslerella dactyloides]